MPNAEITSFDENIARKILDAAKSGKLSPQEFGELVYTLIGSASIGEAFLNWAQSLPSSELSEKQKQDATNAIAMAVNKKEVDEKAAKLESQHADLFAKAASGELFADPENFAIEYQQFESYSTDALELLAEPNIAPATELKITQQSIAIEDQALSRMSAEQFATKIAEKGDDPEHSNSAKILVIRETEKELLLIGIIEIETPQTIEDVRTNSHCVGLSRCELKNRTLSETKMLVEPTHKFVETAKDDRAYLRFLLQDANARLEPYRGRDFETLSPEEKRDVLDIFKEFHKKRELVADHQMGDSFGELAFALPPELAATLKANEISSLKFETKITDPITSQMQSELAFNQQFDFQDTDVRLGSISTTFNDQSINSVYLGAEKTAEQLAAAAEKEGNTPSRG